MRASAVMAETSHPLLSSVSHFLAPPTSPPHYPPSPTTTTTTLPPPPTVSPPQCQQYRERASVLENQPAGTFVLQAQATDADEGANGKVKYGLMHRDSAMPAFRVHPDTGTPGLSQTVRALRPGNTL